MSVALSIWFVRRLITGADQYGTIFPAGINGQEHFSIISTGGGSRLGPVGWVLWVGLVAFFAHTGRPGRHSNAKLEPGGLPGYDMPLQIPLANIGLETCWVCQPPCISHRATWPRV